MEDQVIILRDRRWVEAWSSSKETVMEEIFKTHYRQLWISAYRMLSDQALAEDMVQEVMTRLWQMDNLNHVRTNLGGYLHRSVINQCLNKIKERKRWSLDEDPDQPDPGQERNSKDINVQMEIEQAIQLLPDRCRLVFVFSRYELLSNQEIADLMEISIKTVENQMTMAFKRLRGHLAHLRT
ncbi:MAG: sigma-70 family RNA polymerase sigma factor [Saprospiraceae bacterium]|nr:sigma-70 family RNA polymerase sigma factor [Saprospiraceae bacterium]